MAQGANSLTLSFSGLWRKAVNTLSNLGNHEALGKLGDFTTGPRMIVISFMAIITGEN